MRFIHGSFLLILCIVWRPYGIVAEDRFIEELLIKPLPNSHLYSYFQFVSTWDTGKSFQHCQLLPRSLGEIIHRFQIDELHLTLTEGQWRHEQWGYPITDAAPGAELFVWFSNEVRNVDEQWRYLSETLSGLFCASLNFIDSFNTIQPRVTLWPMSATSQTNNTNSQLRYASLPREIVCTENLTPWKKLLPCESSRGLSTLLNSRMIHNTNYHSLGVHFRKICSNKDCNILEYELKQTVSLVYDLDIVGSSDWSFRKLFGQGLGGSCPLAQSSQIFVDITHTSTPFTLLPAPENIITSVRGGSETRLAVYNVPTSDRMINIVANYYDHKEIVVAPPPPLYFARYIVGYGQEHGGIVTEIINNHWADLHIVLLENAPWWLPLQLSSLRINGVANSDIVTARHFSPGKSRQRPYHLELVMKLPARSTTTVAINFDFVFLKWQEYPPDANHGFYIGSALISALLPTAKNYTSLPLHGSSIHSIVNASQPWYTIVLRTGGAAISLPTPDFSMPYNVICLACTVVALAFGPLHNICTKQLCLRVSTASKSPIERIKSFFKKTKTE